MAAALAPPRRCWEARQRRWEGSWSRSYRWMLLVAVGRRQRCPVIAKGRRRATRGMRYPVDPPTVEEIVLVMRHAGDRPHGLRMRGLIVVIWRAGLRISETLALTESDLDADRGAILIRHGRSDKRREAGMDQWGWDLLRPWLAYRVPDPRRPAVLRHRRCHARPAADDDKCAPAATAHRRQGRRAAALRAASAAARARVEMAREGVPLKRHPAPTRTRQPRDHVRLPARHRQCRGHRHRPLAARADDPRQRRSSPIEIAPWANPTPLVRTQRSAPRSRRASAPPRS